MSLKAKANQGGKGTESAEAAAEAADVSEEEQDGSVNTLDEYLAGKDAEPGVSQHSDADDEEADEAEEDETTEDTDDTESEETEEDADDSEESDQESEEDADENDDEHDGLDLDDEQRKAVGEIIDRKVGKQVAKRKAAEEALGVAEERVAELEAELENSGGTGHEAPGTSENPVLFAESDAEVDRFEAETRRMQKEAKRWLRRHDRDDELTVPQDDGDDATYSYDQIEDRLDELEDLLAETIPQARKQVATRQAATAKAKEAYPKLFDRKSEAYQAMQKVLRQAPQLKALPDYQLMVGRMLAGEALESATPKKKARKVPPKPRAAKPPETSTPTKTKTTPNRPTVKPGARTMDEYLGIT